MSIRKSQPASAIVVRSRRVNPARGRNITHEPAIVDAGRRFVERHPAIHWARIDDIGGLSINFSSPPRIDRIHETVHRHTSDRWISAAPAKWIFVSLPVRGAPVHAQGSDITIH